VTGRVIVCVHLESFKILKDLHANINCHNFGNINKSELFSWPLQGIYRFPCPTIFKFESFKIKETSMADVKAEPLLEAKVELKYNREKETTVNSFCVSVGTQCEQTKEDDSIVVMKFSCSDAEDSVAREQEDTQVVSVTSFNHCVLAVNLAWLTVRSDSLMFFRKTYPLVI
jgi:hypothetical protein